MILLEIIGLVLLSITAVLQIAALATVKWLTFSIGMQTWSYGLFKLCLETKSASRCEHGNWYPDRQGELYAVCAMAIIAFLLVAEMILTFLICKFATKKKPTIPLVISGVVAGLFQIIAVAVFAARLKPEGNDLVKFGASFYVACVAIVTIIAGTVFAGIGTKRSD
ncbi:uncharacterized protein LOC135687987 [Rhopilema esculentum]|uniref:uncharacterized protein LOC135687987 n=1 Tax=Rhopilema esculentum TaxID=499914 RepID=UPI0031E0C25F